MKSKSVTAILDQLYLKGQHWHAKAVEFWDVTDWNNNLLAERDVIAYRKNSYRGICSLFETGKKAPAFSF